MMDTITEVMSCSSISSISWVLFSVLYFRLFYCPLSFLYATRSIYFSFSCFFYTFTYSIFLPPFYTQPDPFSLPLMLFSILYFHAFYSSSFLNVLQRNEVSFFTISLLLLPSLLPVPVVLHPIPAVFFLILFLIYLYFSTSYSSSFNFSYSPSY